MSKFKVGSKYKISGTISRNGDVIQIIGFKSPYYYYKVISGLDTITTRFNENSNIAKGLIEVIEKPDRYELHITCNDGKTTNAVYKVNGKIVERKQAVCSAKDTFDFKVGAVEAFKRVTGYSSEGYGKPTQPEQEDKPKYEYKSGDRVKVLANTNFHKYPLGAIITLESMTWCGSDYPIGKRYWHSHSETEKWVVRESDIEPYTEPEKEPVRLYCVKDYRPEEYFTKGKIYEFDGHCVNYNSIKCFYANDFEDWKRGDNPAAEHVVPLVKRPAKVGEWVLIVKSTSTQNKFKLGDVLKVKRLWNIDGWIYVDDGCAANPDEYEVLDGYQPEPERCPCCGKIKE